MTLNQRKIELLQAFDEAQKIAFAPFIFKAVSVSKRTGLLNALGQSDTPLGVEALSEKTKLSVYAVSVLTDILSAAHVIVKVDGGYLLSKVGQCLIYDRMTEVNFDFSDLVNYLPLDHVQEALQSGKPAGLKTFDAHWQTIYPHLKELPTESRRAWFAFDHFHSDTAYQAALNLLKELPVRYFLDIGGNTGRFTKLALQTWGEARACLVDLPEQIELMRQNPDLASLQSRIDASPVNWLDPNAMPSVRQSPDLIWMSQFLDCFSVDEAVSILKRVKALAAESEATIGILEPLVDRQRNASATLSIASSSLYFSCLANGNSKFFSSGELHAIIDKAGLSIQRIEEPIGIGHSLYLCH